MRIEPTDERGAFDAWRNSRDNTEDDAICQSSEPEWLGWQARAVLALAAPAEPAMIYHFEKRSSFGPWIEVEQPTDKSVAFVKAFPTEQDGRPPGMEAEAVETLTSEGWVWDGDQWVKPAAQSADAVAFAQWLSSDNGVAVMMTPAGREEIRSRAAALSQSTAVAKDGACK